jgi:hypothetical protein
MARILPLLLMTLAGAPPQEGVHVAAERGDAERVRGLVELGQNADVASAKRAGRTPLHTAAEAGHVAVVEVLLEAEVRASPSTREGWTPLHLAAAGGQAEVARRLIAAEAPVGPVDGLGDRPLHLAAENGWRETVELLLGAGAEPDERDRWERTALHRAAAFGYGECVRALLDGGAQVDARSASGGTALSLAAANGDEALYRALVAAGADPSRPDGFGRRPAELFESAQRARQPPRELPAEERARLEPDAAGAPMFHVWKGSRVLSCRLALDRFTNRRVLWPLLRWSASNLIELRITQRSIFSPRPASLAAVRKSMGGTSSPLGLSRRSSTS